MKKQQPSQRGATSAPPADVRMARRAGDVLLFVAGLTALAALLLAGAVRLPFLRIRAITLDGDLAHNSVTAVRSDVLPRLAGNYFTVNLREAGQAFQALPWVRRATVRRVWPDRLMVTLEEHRAAAYWEEGADHAERETADPHLVNAHGEVFEANVGDVEDDDLPSLRGPAGASRQVWEMYCRLVPVFGGLDEHLTELALTARGSWQAGLQSGARFELGRGEVDEVVTRVQRYAATVGQVTTRYHRSVEHADLRHQDAYALRLRGVGTVEAAAAGAASRH